MISIFDYLEYREYLKDRFEEEKANKSFFSYRYLESKTGIDSSFFSKVLKKQKHIGVAKIPELIKIFDIQGKDKTYFEVLVRFNRAKDKQSAEDLFQKLILLRKGVGKKVAGYEYFANWFVIPVREFLNFYDFDGDYKALSLQLHPRITELQARNAIKILQELDLIGENSEGFLKPKDAVLTSGDKWKAVAIQQFQKKMIHLGADALESLEKEYRDISTITLSTSFDSLEFIRERLTQARKEIIEYIANKEEVEGVFQINMQVFPLTQVKK